MVQNILILYTTVDILLYIILFLTAASQLAKIVLASSEMFLLGNIFLLRNIKKKR